MRKLDIEPVLDRIYGSLVDGDWSAVLQTTVESVGGDGAVLHVSDRLRGAPGSFTASAGLDDTFDVNAYLNYWEARSPRIRSPLIKSPLLPRAGRLPEAPVDAPGASAFSAADRHTEFYQDWVRPQGFGDMLGSHLISSPTLSAWLNIRRARRRGIYSPQQVRVANEIGKHIARAIRLRRRMEIHADRATTLKATLDAISFGLILSDESGTIIEANAAADLILRQGAGLRSRARRLVCDDKGEDDALRRALGRPGLHPPDADVTVSRGPGTPPFFLHLVHLADVAGLQSGHRGRPAVAIFIVDPLAGPISLEAFEHAYDVSHAEARLLQQLMATDSLSQAAKGTGVGLSTAKTHLAHLFRKTGTSSQVQLVRLVMKTLLPLRQQS